MTSQHLSYNEDTQTLTVPDVRGVNYLIDGEVVTGELRLSAPTTVTAEPADGFSFPKGVETSWSFGESAEASEELLAVEDESEVR